MSSLFSNLLSLFILLTLSPYILANSETASSSEQHSDSPADTDNPQSSTEPVKDTHGIWKLDDNQFDPFLDIHESVTVLFTRPDDLYSYAGKYHFDRAAHILRDLRNSTTEFAVIEGDRMASKIHEEFGINYWPTVKYCHHDHLTPLLDATDNNTDAQTEEQSWEIRCLDYNHHIVELMLVKWVEGMNGQCAFMINNVDEFTAAKQEHDILFIGFFESMDSLEYQLFEDVCKQYKWERDIWAYEPTFAVVTHKQFANTLSENIPGFISYCEFKEHAWIYNGPMMDRSALRSFIETERYPFFTQITAFNFKQYTEELDLPLIWVAIDDEFESYVKRVGRFYEKLGIEYKGYVAIIWISSQSYMGHIRKLGFPFVPGAMFIDTKNNYKQLYDAQASILDYDKMQTFIKSCLDGTGKLFVKSQDEQDMKQLIEKERKEFGKENILIKHVNGAELHNILEIDEATYGKYNIVVFYYAHWESRSQEFHPIYERIAELLTDDNGFPIYEDLLLVKMDAEANDTPIKIETYPKIFLYRNKMWPKTVSKENWRVYSRKREENRFVKWVKQKCEYETMESVGVGVDGRQDIQEEEEEGEEDSEEEGEFEYD